MSNSARFAPSAPNRSAQATAHALRAADDQHGLAVEACPSRPSAFSSPRPRRDQDLHLVAVRVGEPLDALARRRRCIPILLVTIRSTGSVPAAIWARIRGRVVELERPDPGDGQVAPDPALRLHRPGAPRWIAMTADGRRARGPRRRTRPGPAGCPSIRWRSRRQARRSARVTSPATSADAGSKTVAPLRSAISRRAACGSDRKIDPAPAAAATSTASWPIGPPPVIRTLPPGRRPERSTPCTTVASGSSTAPCSNETPSGSGTTW